MKKSLAIPFLKSIILIPIPALILIPYLLHLLFPYNLAFYVDPFYITGISILGSILILAGIYLGLVTVSLHITIGQGTPAPWNPPKNLILEGPYKRTRNPMITGALLILFGEALLFGSLTLLIYALIFFPLNHLYFILHEEPLLEKRYGKPYLEYKQSVPRWFPKLR